MAEIYLEKGSLIKKEKWERIIEQQIKLRTEETSDMLTRIGSHNLNNLISSLTGAVIKRAENAEKNIGILFSGGVDSALIALILKQYGFSTISYTVGFKDKGTKEPEDIIESRKTARILGLKHKTLILDLERSEKLFERCAKILKEYSNVVTIGVGSVVLAAAEMALKDGIRSLFGGLGSEEIFAGYQRHDDAGGNDKDRFSRVHDECWRGLKMMYDRDLVRDVRIAETLGISLLTPFLDEDVIISAMKIPASEKIKYFGGRLYKKFALRRAASIIGLPQEVAFRPKRAAQYGSRTDKAIEKLAKRRGLSKSSYINWLMTKNPVEGTSP